MSTGVRWAIVAMIGLSGGTLLSAPPASTPKPATQPASLPPGWEEVDQRMVFLTVQLSTVESTVDATNKALKAAGYKLAAQQEAAEKARKGNELMDRNGGGPVRWQEFYSRTTERFFYRSSSGETLAVTVDQRPPQFDYIYRANENARAKSEQDAAAIGTKIDDLLDYRKGLENQQSALWAKIALRGVSSLEISTRPLYQLDAAPTAAGDAAKDQAGAIKAAATFLKAIDAETSAAQKSIDGDQKGAFDHLLQVTTDARAAFNKSMGSLGSVGDAMRDPKAPIGQVNRSVKRLEDSAQNLVDAYKLAHDADAAGDVVAFLNYRGQLQQMIFDYAVTVATLDRSLTKAASDWKIKPGTAKAPDPTPVNIEPSDIAGKLDAAKAARDRDVANAKRQLVAVIDQQVNAAADAGDLKTVKTLQAAMDQASKDGSLPEDLRDEKILAAKQTLTKSIATANGKLADAYTEAVKAYTKARRLSEAQATQDELAALALVPAGAAPGGDEPPTPVKSGGSTPSGAPGPFAPPKLAEGATTIELPGPVEGSAVGGSGRYLIFHIKKLQQLAIFDVSQAKVTKFIAVPSNDITFTAGDKKLFVGVRDLKKLQRWDLASGSLELTAPAPQGGVQTIAMGACSSGPLILSGGVGGGQDRESKRFWQLNPTSFRADLMPSEHWDDWRGPEHVFVSFDGSTGISSGGYWAGAELYRITGGKVVSHSSGTYVQGEATIAGNGSLVFRDKGGIPVRGDLTTEVKGIEGEPFAACDAAFSLALQHNRDRKKPSAALVVYANGDPRPLVTLRDLPELAKDTKLRPWERVFLIPVAKCLVTVGEGGDNLVLRSFDLAKEMEAEGVDFLFVESAAPSSADLGGKFSYKVVVRSKKGGVKMELQSAPKGMTMSKEGVITWTVPRRLDEKTPTVIVAISDASGQSVFHSFTINCGEASTKK